MDQAISDLAFAVWDRGATPEEQAIYRINDLWQEVHSLPVLQSIQELLDALDSYIGDEHEGKLGRIRKNVEKEEERVRLIEDLLLDRIGASDLVVYIIDEYGLYHLVSLPGN